MAIGKSFAEKVMQKNIEKAVIHYDSSTSERKVKPITFGTSTDELAPYQVYRTYDYGKFKIMEGNRKVLDARIKKILESYDKIGNQPTPLIVNEKFEILDGQGRYGANKKRGYPIDYIIVVGGTIEDCRVINQANTPWGEEDYIDSQAQTGNEDYIRAKYLHDICAFTYLGVYDFSYNRLHCGAAKKLTYCGGHFKLPVDTFEFIKDNANTLNSFDKFIEILGARKEQVQASIYWLMRHKNIDIKHLKENIADLDVQPVTNARGKTTYSYPRAVAGHVIKDVESLFTFIVELYNEGLPKNKQLNIKTLLKELKNSAIKGEYAKNSEKVTI